MADEELNQSSNYVESEIGRRLKSIESLVKADVIACIHPMGPPFDDIIRDMVEDIPDKQESLFVILETVGGSIETTERIADVFRHHYKGEISFLVPNFAMSAGTVLVMSGDRIFMDYYSILGPIDPQIRRNNGGYVPALGYLEKYKEMIDKSSRNELTGAELAILIEKFDPAELHRFEQAKEHSTDLLKKWLVTYKFKNWTRTAGRGIEVTDAMREERAAEIAATLNDTTKWRSHGRGLSMAVIQSDLKLVVEDFGANAELNRLVRGYYRLLQDYMGSKSQTFAVQTRQRLWTPLRS